MAKPGRSEQLGRCIRDSRKEAGFTQQALADAIACSKAQLSLMEAGLRTISPERVRQIESALKITDRRIMSLLQWQSVPAALRAQMQRSQSQSQVLASQLRRALAAGDPVQELRRLIPDAHDEDASSDEPTHTKARQRGRSTLGTAGNVGGAIPIINKLAAGYPTEFTDLDYPVSVADEYIACPDVSDPDAFAARVVGNSMEPDYFEGDIVVFSPKLATPAGCDCFVRLERNNHTTFKRIYFEDDDQVIRLQPLNNSYPPQLVPREAINGMYAAAYVMRKIKIQINK